MAEERARYSGKFADTRKAALTGDIEFYICNNDPTIVVTHWALNNGPLNPINVGQTCTLPNVDPDCLNARAYQLIGNIPGGAPNTVMHIRYKKSGSPNFCGASTPPFTTPKPPNFWVGEIQNGTLHGCG